MITTAKEVNRALLEYAKRDDNCVFMAEGIQEPTRFFGTLAGLSDVTKKDNLIELPIAESSMVGVGVGLAQAGSTVVMNFQRVEFVLLALEQIFNNAAKAYFLSDGAVSVPLVLRLVVGRGWGQGPSHSQSLESMFSMFPGLKVVMPSLPNYAFDVVTTALEDRNPVIIIEHRWCHYLEARDRGKYNYRPWHAIIVQPGADISIAATGYAVAEAIALAKELLRFNISLEIIDISSTRPLDIETIEKSVDKTGRLVVIDTGHTFLGIGSEVVSQVVVRAWKSMKCPPTRMGLPEYPVPSSRFMVDRYQYYPSVVSICFEILNQLNYPEARRPEIIESIKSIQAQYAIDQPNSDFKGPF